MDDHPFIDTMNPFDLDNFRDSEMSRFIYWSYAIVQRPFVAKVGNKDAGNEHSMVSP